MGPLKVFDYETWTWRDATPAELKKQEAADAIRYGTAAPTPPAPGERTVEINGRRFTIYADTFGQIGNGAEISEDLRAYIKANADKLPKV